MNKIISIDKDAERYRKGINDLLIKKQIDLEENIKHIKQEWIKEEKSIKESIIKDKLCTAEEKAKSIIFETEEQLKIIRNKYNENDEQIVNEIFTKIVNSL